MADENTLVTKPQDDKTAVSGVGILESANDLANGISSGDWVEAGLGVAGAGLEVLSMVIDPIGTVASYGVGWLIEHVQPLKEALDWFAGDPPVIRSFSETWGNVAAEVAKVAQDFGNEAKTSTAGWQGEAADMYRRKAAETSDAVGGAGALADGVSAGVMIMGEVVAAVRELVRDLVAEVVGKLISWALELVASLGLATPVVVAQAASAVAKTVSKIAEFVRKLVKTIGNVTPRLRKVIDKLGEIMEKLGKLGRKGDVDGSTTPSGTSSPSTRPDGPSTPETTNPSAHGLDGSAGTDTPGTTGSGTDSPDGIRGNTRNNPRDAAKDTDSRHACGDPIDVASGEMFLPQDDVELPGVLPLVLRRNYISSYRVGRLFGTTWASTVDQRIEVDAQGVCYAAEDGALLSYPAAPADGSAVLPSEGARWPLASMPDGGYTITVPERGQTLYFAPADTTDRPLSAIVDRNANRIDFLRDTAGVLTEVSHSCGYRIGVDTDGGLVTGLRLLGADVPLVRYRYDEARRLVEVINSSKQALRFDYDSRGRIVRWEDRNGRWYQYTYDGDGRCVRTEGSGGFLSGAFDYRHRETTYIDSLGHRTTYHFNDLGQLIREVNPLGHTTRHEWDRYDRMLSRTDPLGRQTMYGYDQAGNLCQVTYPDGSVAHATYNDLGLPVVVVGTDGATWLYAYDDAGNHTSTTDPSGATTTYTYDGNGAVSAIVDALGNRRVVDNNAAGLPTAITDPLGATTRYMRDMFGRVAEVVDPVGGVTRQRWTVEGNLLSRALPSGALEQWRYDPEGNQVQHIDALGATTRVQTTHFDLPAGRTNPDGTRLEFGYDTEMRLVSVTNQQGLVWRYEYDGAGRLVGEKDFNGRALTYRLDEAGQLIERVNGAGQVVRFVRDPLGNVTERHAGGVLTTFAYDAASRLIRAGNPDADVVFQRDPLGWVLAETVNGRTVTSTYDALGRRTRRCTPSGMDSRWEYDGNGQPISLRTYGKTLRFDYDPAGREVRRHLGAGAVLSQTWDSNHRLSGQAVATDSASLVLSRGYRYRQDGCLLGVDDRFSGSRRYTLDTMGRVTAVHHAIGWTERYAYDAAGNLAAATWPSFDGESDAQGGREYVGTLLRGAGKTRYEHDTQGRVVLRQRKRLSSKPDTWRYEWDAEDRLIGVVTPDGARWRYRYDPLGRRIAKQLLDGGYPVEQIGFVWDGSLLAEQAHSSGRTTTWDWEPGSFRPVTQVEHGSQEWVDQQFYAIVTDLIGTPTELVEPGGMLAWRRQTTLWGAALVSAGAGPHCPLRFPGQYWDSETGMSYNFRRYYDPENGRYTSNDPLGLDPAPNPQSYVLNPTGWLDPLGLSATKHCPDPQGRPRYSGTDKPLTTGATPNSVYTHVDANGRAVQNAVYDANGDVIGHVDFKQHGSAPPGHYHTFPEPGKPASGHGPGKPHHDPSTQPPGWGDLPGGIEPRN